MKLAETETDDSLQGKRVAFVGKLGGVTKREAQQFVRQHGGVPVESSSEGLDLIVIGADELPLENEELLEPDIRDAAAEGRLEIIQETQLWQQLGMMGHDQEGGVRRLYTPAMLADLLAVPVAVIRRWHRRGLIVPVREVNRLPYFDFQEVSTARHLAQLVASGASPAAIEKKLGQLARYVPEVERPLAQLSVIVEGKQILLRQGEGLIEPGGQLRIDFDALGVPVTEAGSQEETAEEAILSFDDSCIDRPLTPDEMIEAALELEDRGELARATEMFRAVMAAVGPRPDLCFEVAELLYRQGEILAARERYYMVVELDEEYVEARANLGCVLAETGELQLAVAAFRGALSCHQDYPDVHYHLARTLDELGEEEQSEFHWRSFLALAPNSPWAEEARARVDNWQEDK